MSQTQKFPSRTQNSPNRANDRADQARPSRTREDIIAALQKANQELQAYYRGASTISKSQIQHRIERLKQSLAEIDNPISTEIEKIASESPALSGQSPGFPWGRIPLRIRPRISASISNGQFITFDAVPKSAPELTIWSGRLYHAWVSVIGEVSAILPSGKLFPVAPHLIEVTTWRDRDGAPEQPSIWMAVNRNKIHNTYSSLPDASVNLVITDRIKSDHLRIIRSDGIIWCRGIQEPIGEMIQVAQIESMRAFSFSNPKIIMPSFRKVQRRDLNRAALSASALGNGCCRLCGSPRRCMCAPYSRVPAIVMNDDRAAREIIMAGMDMVMVAPDSRIDITVQGSLF